MKAYELETVSGKLIDLNDPDPTKITIKDIAWALSRLPRYTGHTIQITPYAVGQHSEAVAKRIVERLDDVAVKGHPRPLLMITQQIRSYMFMQGLLHDAGEAYTGDISGPLKKIPELRAVIKPIEAKIDKAIFKALGLKEIQDTNLRDFEFLIKEADHYCQTVEAYNFMASRGLDWSNRPDVSLQELQRFEMPMDSIRVYERFMHLFESHMALLVGSEFVINQ